MWPSLYGGNLGESGRLRSPALRSSKNSWQPVEPDRQPRLAEVRYGQPVVNDRQPRLAEVEPGPRLADAEALALTIDPTICGALEEEVFARSSSLADDRRRRRGDARRSAWDGAESLEWPVEDTVTMCAEGMADPRSQRIDGAFEQRAVHAAIALCPGTSTDPVIWYEPGMNLG